MSQNRTIIQGLEPADPQGYGAPGAYPNPYSRGANPASRGTVVPGMMGPAPGQPGFQQPVSDQPVKGRPIQLGKPVAGFLYSVSRTGAGEYWPLQIGQNVIGQSPTCDVVLPEGTVSSEHAVLVVRKMKKPEKVIASISDARSTNGTMLNGESLGFTAVECHNGDIITIGDNYELYLMLVDPASLGLTVSESFIPVELEPLQPEVPDIPSGYTRQAGVNMGDDNISAYPNQGGTVGFDGYTGNPNRGGTVGM